MKPFLLFLWISAIEALPTCQAGHVKVSNHASLFLHHSRAISFKLIGLAVLSSLRGG